MDISEGCSTESVSWLFIDLMRIGDTGARWQLGMIQDSSGNCVTLVFHPPSVHFCVWGIFELRCQRITSLVVVSKRYDACLQGLTSDWFPPIGLPLPSQVEVSHWLMEPVIWVAQCINWQHSSPKPRHNYRTRRKTDLRIDFPILSHLNLRFRFFGQNGPEVTDSRRENCLNRSDTKIHRNRMDHDLWQWITAFWEDSRLLNIIWSRSNCCEASLFSRHTQNIERFSILPDPTQTTTLWCHPYSQSRLEIFWAESIGCDGLALSCLSCTH
jgi:hypothetical protein